MIQDEHIRLYGKKLMVSVFNHAVNTYQPKSFIVLGQGENDKIHSFPSSWDCVPLNNRNRRFDR